MSSPTKFPCDVCRGICCTSVPMTRKEIKLFRKKYGLPKGARLVDIGIGTMVVKAGTANECAFLLSSGKCGVYEDRPTVCRLYGEVPDMPCAFMHPENAQTASYRLADRLGLISVDNLVRDALKDIASRK